MENHRVCSKINDEADYKIKNLLTVILCFYLQIISNIFAKKKKTQPNRNSLKKFKAEIKNILLNLVM